MDAQHDKYIIEINRRLVKTQHIIPNIHNYFLEKVIVKLILK